MQAVGNWAAELEDWDYPVKVTYRSGKQEWVDPRVDVSARGLLVGVDIEDVRSWGGNARWVDSQLGQLNRMFNVAIRLGPARNLRGK